MAFVACVTVTEGRLTLYSHGWRIVPCFWIQSYRPVQICEVVSSGLFGIVIWTMGRLYSLFRTLLEFCRALGSLGHNVVPHNAHIDEASRPMTENTDRQLEDTLHTLLAAWVPRRVTASSTGNVEHGELRERIRRHTSLE